MDPIYFLFTAAVLATIACVVVAAVGWHQHIRYHRLSDQTLTRLREQFDAEGWNSDE